MLNFLQFVSEEKHLDYGHQKPYVGYGHSARDFWETLTMPSHPVTDSIRKAMKLDEAFDVTGEVKPHQAHMLHQAHKNEALHHESAENEKARGNVLVKIKKGAEAAFPKNESEATRNIKHKEAVKAWHSFKRDYEAGENKKREIENKHIDAHDAHAAEHNKTAAKKDKIKPLKKRKALDLQHGSELLSENGKYDPEHHVGKHASGKKVKIKGLALAPHTIAGGVNVCPKASTACKRDCLALHAGMNRGEERNYHLKVARSQFLQKHPEHAVRMISKEIDKHVASAKKKGYEPAVRLNANSDIPIEHVLGHGYWKRHGKGGSHAAEHYDYTKIAGRMSSPSKREELKKKGYHLTLSSTGTNHHESNDKEVSKHLHSGGNAAVVFRTRESGDLPHTVVTHYPDGSKTAHPVHSANERDDRYNDEAHHPHGSNAAHEKFLKDNPHIKRGKGQVAGLTFKGNTNDEMKSTEFAVDSHHGVAHIKGH